MKFPQPLTLASMATLLDAEAVGDPQHLTTGLNEIHMVEAGDVTFVDHPKYYDKALNSNATTILINKMMEAPSGKALLVHPDPFAAFIALIRQFRPFVPATAAVSPLAVIGEGTVVQPGAFIGNHVVIGKNCVIHSNVSIYDHCIVGDNVVIHANSVLGADAYYFQKKNGEFRKFESCGRVVIGDKVEIGALCTIDRGVTGDTTIDTDTKLDNHVQVGHDTYIGKHCLIGAHCAIAGVTRIEDDVLLWGRVSVNKDLVIGKGAVVLATSGVDKSIEGGKTYFGIPVDESRKRWRELASLKQLPALVARFSNDTLREE
ncbi:MAG: UDP-3-O-(3-hydroxymyristoyl)glucosamine N-acyltransferase [Bacteroidales bacterium]|nr:UDP-3-O-(3-hydroxymyristoyl)glucosamine N-acyltransferase [Bacteroidales bacterium]MDD3664217.1 UDP-3-O-(3-hydroxymyristoyl)glucosamine N-acyltransferase [Bacteroidales bacterium]